MVQFRKQLLYVQLKGIIQGSIFQPGLLALRIQTILFYLYDNPGRDKIVLPEAKGQLLQHFHKLATDCP